MVSMERHPALNWDLVKWLYMRVGDYLEVENHTGERKRIGPIMEIDWRANKEQFESPDKKQVLVAAPWDNSRLVRVPLAQVYAVIRQGVEVIRFQSGEQRIFQGMHCAGCGQREVDESIPGNRFCSIHCQQKWIENYYQDYPPGQNPIDKGEYIHTVNCGECRKLNRIYCPSCVD